MATTIYATIGDTISSRMRVNKETRKEELEEFTVEGKRVIENVPIDGDFAEKYREIQEQWPGAIVRFHPDPKPNNKVAGAGA